MMFEEFAWEMFTKTGSIDGYLLYKELKEQKESYGTFENQRSCHPADQSERQ